MITYEEALLRHQTTPLARAERYSSHWHEVEVGTTTFWKVIGTGLLIAFKSGGGVYVGIVDEYDLEMEGGFMWVHVRPDPSQPPLPAIQDTLPVSFCYRDKIMLEIA